MSSKKMQKIKEIFEKYDINDDKFLDIAELDHFITIVFEKYPKEFDLDRIKANILSKYDKDKNNKISLDEFIYFFK